MMTCPHPDVEGKTFIWRLCVFIFKDIYSKNIFYICDFILNDLTMMKINIEILTKIISKHFTKQFGESPLHTLILVRLRY